jgi:hypothetical protein
LSLLCMQENVFLLVVLQLLMLFVGPSTYLEPKIISFKNIV